MAKVPDLESDFAQKLLQDLRRQRERLGFEASTAQRSSSNAAPRGNASSSSQKPLRAQKPFQGAPRVGKPEATTHRSYQQSSNAMARVAKPRHRDAPRAPSHAIVPVGRGGRGQEPAAANNMDVQMALALALSNSGKLQNIGLVTRGGSIVLAEQQRMQHHGGHHRLFAGDAHVGKVAVGVQRLNDILVAYSSGARDSSRRGSVEIGKQLFRGAMDLEESLGMLVMLQEASDYMEGSGHGKVLLLKGRESRKKLMHSSRSAKLVEIVDQDSETEQAKNGKNSSDASLQLVVHKRPQSYSTPGSNLDLQVSSVGDTSEGNASKVRMPGVIAKLMGLEELPPAKAVAARKGTEKFVKPEAVARKEKRANAMGGKLPIRILPPERVLVKGQFKNLPAREQKSGVTASEESESVSAMWNGSWRPMSDKQKAKQTMKDMLSKVESAEKRGNVNQGVDEQIMHEHEKPDEESKMQKVIKESVRYRSDTARKMDLLRKFRKSSGNGSATEEKHLSQESNKVVKKQATNMKQFSGRESEVKSKRTKEKFNKENLAIAESKVAGMNGQTDLMKRQAQGKQTGKQNMTKNTQNNRERQSETVSRNVEDKRSLKAGLMKKKHEQHSAVLQQEIEMHTKVNETGGSKASDNPHGGILEETATKVKGSNTDEGALSNHSVKQITQATNDPITAVAHTGGNPEVLDQTATAETNDSTNHTATKTKQMTETFTKEEQQKQVLDARKQPMEGLNQTKKSNNPADLQDQKMTVISCHSFTENQRLLAEMLLKDQYLLNIVKEIIIIHTPIDVTNVTAKKQSDKGNKVLSDIEREVIRRKGKRNEAMVNVSTTHTAARFKLQSLDGFIRELDGDIGSLNISNEAHQHDDESTAETLHIILHRDIENRHPDVNSMWDFGWNYISDLPVEKYEVVRDMEKNILTGIITELARELIEVSVVRHVCCEA